MVHVNLNPSLDFQFVYHRRQLSPRGVRSVRALGLGYFRFIPTTAGQGAAYEGVEMGYIMNIRYKLMEPYIKMCEETVLGSKKILERFSELYLGGAQIARRSPRKGGKVVTQ